MDNLKEYMKMCEKGYDDLLPLAQTLKNGTIIKYSNRDDFFVVINEYEINYAEKLYGYDIVNIKTGERFTTSEILEEGFVIWLQDQLQEMYLNNRKHKVNCGQMSMFFEDWRTNELMRYGKDLIDWSMAQLWIAFVMNMIYNKVWNGKDWRMRGCI